MYNRSIPQNLLFAYYLRLFYIFEVNNVIEIEDDDHNLMLSYW